MMHPNPPVCRAELALREGRAHCELPAGHVGPHRASGESHSPVPGLVVHWDADHGRAALHEVGTAGAA